MSEIFVNEIRTRDTSGGGEPTITTYNIEAQRMSCGNVGSDSKPVYFENGFPVECSGDIGGGGGSDVVITPDSEISHLNRAEKQEIATFKIGDNPTQSLYIPRYSSGYVKQALFTGQLGENTGGEGGAALAMPFTNFDFIYIYVEDTKNLIGCQVVTVPTAPLKQKLDAGQALVSCNLYATLGMVIRFTSTTGFRIEYVNNLPNYDSPSSDEGQISVILTKIEGITLGISKGSWGKNTREAIWIGEASEVDEETKIDFIEEKELKEYDFIYVYGHILNEDEEHIDLGSVDYLAERMLEDKAIFTCGSFENISKTLKFENDGFYIIGGNDVGEDEDTLTYVVTQIDGLKYGAEVNDVVIFPTLTSGVKIADYSIGSVEGSLYAPSGSGTVVDEVTEGDMNAVTSNAVYNILHDENYVVDSAQSGNMNPITSNAVYSALGGLVLVKITQAQYDLLPIKDPNTLYLIGDWV